MAEGHSCVTRHGGTAKGKVKTMSGLTCPSTASVGITLSVI